ncbi:MAG: hypothetical protein K2Y22_17120 [Candidatus Obscuribacterales bacterium]|nr:hypothetical protein [Candidatus Obscuribacterales bacterium]
MYPATDLIGQLITSNFNPYRLVALLLAGGLVYQYEIPTWFNRLSEVCLPKKVAGLPVLRHLTENRDEQLGLNGLARTIGAVFYFNPFWIARHMLFIKLATTSWSELMPTMVLFWAIILATKMFILNLPIAVMGNFIIQDKLPLHLRYAGSIILSTIFSITYALAYAWAK